MKNAYLRIRMDTDLLLDIHTHRLPDVPGTAVVSVCPPQFQPLAGHLYSVGLHPWRIGEEGLTMDALAAAAQHPQVVAVGEAGLDRLARAPLEQVQLPLFEQQARLADELGLPLVIHLVRCTAEVLASRRRLRPQVPWVVHGFRGKRQLAEELLRHGLYLSFGERYQAEALRATPPDRLLLETDESPVPIEDLYARAAACLARPAGELLQAVQANVRRCFFSRKNLASSRKGRIFAP